MRRTVPLPVVLCLTLLLPGALLFATEESSIVLPDQDAPAVTDITAEEEAPFNEFNIADFMKITVHGDLWFYHIWTENAYHVNNSDASLTEMTARLGADLEFTDAEWVKAQFRIVGTDVFGEPDNWTVPREEDFDARPDLANVSLTAPLGDMSATLVVGLQELCYGDGLLIYDGRSEKRVVWTTPVRSFPAARLTFQACETCSIDFFAAQVDNDHRQYEAYLGGYQTVEGGGELYGVNATSKTETFGQVDLGVFVKEEDIRSGPDSDSDTIAITLRDSYDISDFNITGEIVKQYGKTRVVQNAIANNNAPRRDRDAWGGHLTATYTVPVEDIAPYVRARYAYFSGDRPGTDDVESFDPFFYGFPDWGSWYLGDMTSYSLTNTNERAFCVELGVTPTPETKVRFFYYDFDVDKETANVTNRSFSNEYNLVIDYYPSGWVDGIDFFFGVMGGVVVPDDGAKALNGDDETQVEVIGWAGVYF